MVGVRLWPCMLVRSVDFHTGGLEGSASIISQVGTLVLFGEESSNGLVTHISTIASCKKTGAKTAPQPLAPNWSDSLRTPKSSHKKYSNTFGAAERSSDES